MTVEIPESRIGELKEIPDRRVIRGIDPDRLLMIATKSKLPRLDNPDNRLIANSRFFFTLTRSGSHS